ncbi:hypothetical protein SCLCIDRAFT_1209209 [Scleroderma citrinum Foug A]|uniref:Uncharacterized protein n=1 Tax=Scleroderma citrinum Foug A TaxID=1036808 RepID=A0A0C3E6G0_9AGAM|nr:hypothetical protein SCLCIDRAFT_1209209 [Scleroderma citrinum Foug A]
MHGTSASMPSEVAMSSQRIPREAMKPSFSSTMTPALLPLSLGGSPITARIGSVRKFLLNLLSRKTSISPRTKERILDPAEVKKQFDRTVHFRILIISRSNAGKTTLIQRVCNTMGLPEIFNAKGEKIDPAIVLGSHERGDHNIEDELIFPSNPGFIFHDSGGFENGSVNELNLVKDFVAHRAATMKLEKRIHVIWYCFSMADYERPILAAEEKFFDECNTGNVPVIAVLTKADALTLPALSQLRDEGLTMREAMPKAGELAAQMLSILESGIENQLCSCRYPPKAYLTTACMNQEGADCSPLLSKPILL